MIQGGKKVVWFEGMTLDPHHFQQWDRHRDAKIDARIRAVDPHGWGLGACSIDEERLTNGELAVTDCTAVMPDGLVVNVPASSPLPDARNVQDHLSSTDESIRVFLTVPSDRPNGRNIQLQGSEHERVPRFVAESSMQRDENTGESKRPVELAHPNVQIRFADEAQQGYSALPIAEVERAGGGFRLTTDFVPPCLYIESSDRLARMAGELLQLLVSKKSELSDYKEEAFAQRELSPSDITSLNRLALLNSFIPRVAQFETDGKRPPRSFFQTLTSLFGGLATYVEEPPVEPRNVPTYDHSDPTEAFLRVEQLLRQMLGEATPTADYERLDLRRKRENLLEASANQTVLEDSRLFLVVRSEKHSEAELTNSLPEMLRVASPDTIDDVLQSYTQALAVSATQRLPANMPVDNQATYFKMEKRGPFWSSICDEEGIAVFVPSDFQELEVDLLAVS